MKPIFKIAFVIALLFDLCACDRKPTASLFSGGNPDRGRREIEYYGCASCHVVPGVAGANGLIGPSLEQVGDRNFIGGVVKNTPDNLMHWVENAPGIDPKTAMPRLDIPDREARDIVSYLYTLR
jgi:cytochrome c